MEMLSKGNHFVLASGRSVSSIFDVLEVLDIQSADSSIPMRPAAFNRLTSTSSCSRPSLYNVGCARIGIPPWRRHALFCTPGESDAGGSDRGNAQSGRYTDSGTSYIKRLIGDIDTCPAQIRTQLIVPVRPRLLKPRQVFQKYRIFVVRFSRCQ